jgi:hypothetical protein
LIKLFCDKSINDSHHEGKKVELWGSPQLINMNIKWHYIMLSIISSCHNRDIFLMPFGFLTFFKGLATHWQLWKKVFAMGESLYLFTCYVLCLQFCDVFATRFSSHQFQVAIKGSYELVIRNIMCTLDLHPNWIVL